MNKYTRAIGITLIFVFIVGLAGFSYLQYTRSTELEKRLDATKDAVVDLEKKLEKVEERTAEPADNYKVTTSLVGTSNETGNNMFMVKCGLSFLMSSDVRLTDSDGIERFWIARDSTEYGSLEGSFKNGYNYTMYLGPNDSGYVSAHVETLCIDADKNLTLKSFVDDYIDSMVKLNESSIKALSLEQYAKDFYVKNLGAQKKWGMDTYKVEMKIASPAESYKQEGNIFIANGKAYYVYTIHGSTVPVIIDSMNSIFNSLKVL